MFLRTGETVAVEDLLKGMLVQSGNDATVALVEHVAPAPGAFVARMNAEAARLGLADTHFTNVSGLQNAEHYSTARDLTRLAAALRRDFPERAGLFALREFTWAGIRQPNRNVLLRDPQVDGLKTGHTGTAGYCLVASAERDGQQLIATVLGSDSEAERAHAGRALLDFGVRHFETRTLYTTGQALTRLRVWQGKTDAVEIGAAQALVLTLPRGAFETLRARAELPASLQAPVARGATLGQLTLTTNGHDVAQLPLVALAEVPPGGLAKRAADRLRLWFGGQGQAQAAP
jgi:D-alanyl-D-alanine carboxypeptidase (penicillin-binding protein 5/6)